ncbi:MAG: hypothetical protein C0417_02720 [Chlorobiaceae bacterium]|nr:hypothetical protein [Chlorobiaceae bacterium]
MVEGIAPDQMLGRFYLTINLRFLSVFDLNEKSGVLQIKYIACNYRLRKIFIKLPNPSNFSIFTLNLRF